MPVDDTLKRLASLTPEDEERLAERYWDDLNAAHPRERRENALEPIIQRYAERHDDLTRFDLGMAAGELGSRLHHHDRTDTTIRYEVERAYTDVQAMKEVTPASAECMDILVGDVLPEYMDEIGL